MVGQDGVIDSVTQPAGATPTVGDRPNGGDDGGAHSGKPATTMKTHIRQMQTMSRLILYRVVHYEDWAGNLPPDLINVAC